MRKRLSGLGVIAAALALVPQAAQAHLVATGMGPLYDGATHFALSPEDVLPVAALALFAGLRGPPHARRLLFIVPVAWFAGGALTVLFGASVPIVAMSIATAVLLMLIGILLAANLDLSPGLAAVVAWALGLVRGAVDLSGFAPGSAAALTLLGMSVAVFAVFALATSISLPLRRFWMIIATRIAGSWMAAAGLLLAGWIIRYGAGVRG